MTKQTTAQERAKAIRQKTGMSQVAFAKEYHIPRRTIENWESGVNAPPSYVLYLLELVVKHRLAGQTKK